ncbi:ABC transporter permease [Corynebacterium pelargi]|uniref:Glutathione transport system permease protein GsiC n=1 Tax=Corynebacterium pelargi TaxID=1471400 RepID=A0A410W7D0_9CORY|nr:ABC transporter permease [Corynebacterium pelargi]QAU51875.1 Glutathione transport system permease protein GsiC [Corynebacterium pelargi]GGG71800.1 ABC transporter permease [Corynebacterium pelargi]
MKLRAVARHLLRYAITLVLASVLIFLALRIIPGNPAEIALGVTATEESVAKLEADMGLDQPAWQQYLQWVTGMLQGNFGQSIVSGADISSMVVDRLQVSLILVTIAMVLALLIAVPMGMWAAQRSARIDGVLVSALSQIGIAIPSFLTGILLIALFSVHLGWLPPNGWVVPREHPGAFIARIILPCVALGLVQAAIMTRYVRTAILDILHNDYMRTARAIGLSPVQALFRHGLRNAALPVLTVAGMQLTSLLIGAVVIEKVFAIPGLGSMLLQAVSNRDLPTVQTTVMMLVILTICVNALVDVTYALVDPRTKRSNR